MRAAPRMAVCHGRDGCSTSSHKTAMSAPSSQGTLRSVSRKLSQTRSGKGSR